MLIENYFKIKNALEKKKERDRLINNIYIYIYIFYFNYFNSDFLIDVINVLEKN